MRRFTLHRLWAIVLKEFIQMRRDRVTFGMMVGIPLLQLTLFGFAINTDPKHLPAAVRAADHGTFARTLVEAMRHSGYFAFVREAATGHTGGSASPSPETPFDWKRVMMALWAAGGVLLVLRLGYGIALQSWPLILSNGIILPLAGTILLFKLKYK